MNARMLVVECEGESHYLTLPREIKMGERTLIKTAYCLGRKAAYYVFAGF